MMTSVTLIIKINWARAMYGKQSVKMGTGERLIIYYTY
jgi:hypothetical protein